MGDFLNKEGIDEIRKGWDKIKILQEEMRSMREDIGEEKKEIAKKSGIKVRELNKIFKIVADKEKGEWDDDDVWYNLVAVILLIKKNKICYLNQVLALSLVVY